MKNIKKSILFSGAVFLGVLFLAGCGAKQGGLNSSDSSALTPANSQMPSDQEEAVDDSQPVQASDVDKELDQIDKELDSVSADDFNADDLSDTGIEK